MRCRTTLLIILLLGLLPILHAVHDLDGWRQDLEFYRKELPARHVNLFAYTTREAFNRELDLLEKDLPNLSELDACLRLERITIGIGDDHTSIRYPKTITNDLTSLPLIIGWFEDGIYVLGVQQRFKPALATRIVAVGNTPIDQAMAKLASVISTTNQMWVKRRAPDKFAVLNFWQQVGLAEPNGSIKLKCMGPDQLPYTFEVKPIEEQEKSNSDAKLIKARYKACPTAEPTNPFFSVTKLDNGKTLYAQYNKCGGREIEEQRGKGKEAVAELPSINEFFDQILSELRSDKIEKLIFDLRWNGGGNSAPGTTFVKKLAKLKAINQRGKIFVLIGRRTFSAAVMNADDFKSHTQAILIGEPTGGNASGYGDFKSFELRHTQIKVNFSTKYFRRDGGNKGPLLPHIAVGRTFEDYLKGIDPVMETALHYQAGPGLLPK